MSKLSPETREKLKKISTATLTTALFKRGLHHQMIQDVHPLNPAALPMVGEAFTLPGAFWYTSCGPKVLSSGFGPKPPAWIGPATNSQKPSKSLNCAFAGS